jgi:hypothetical protein
MSFSYSHHLTTSKQLAQFIISEIRYKTIINIKVRTKIILEEYL